MSGGADFVPPGDATAAATFADRTGGRNAQALPLHNTDTTAPEVITITLGQDVQLDGIKISQFIVNDNETLTLNGVTIIDLTSEIDDVDVIAPIQFPTDAENDEGEGGYSLDDITINAIPEPTTLVLISLGLLVALRRRRR